jgi:hypothetical protein
MIMRLRYVLKYQPSLTPGVATRPCNADAFLSIVDVPKFTDGPARDRARTMIAGCIITAFFQALSILLVGWVPNAKSAEPVPDAPAAPKAAKESPAPEPATVELASGPQAQPTPEPAPVAEPTPAAAEPTPAAVTPDVEAPAPQAEEAVPAAEAPTAPDSEPAAVAVSVQ